MADETKGAMDGVKTAAGAPKHIILSFLPEIGIGLLILIILWITYGLLKKFHIIGMTEADKLHEAQDKADAADAIKLDTNIVLNLTGSPLEANRFPSAKEFSNQYFFSTSKVIELAKRIYDAKGTFHDNEDEAISAIDECPSKYTAKVIAYYFNQTYKKDLRVYLKTFMNDSELAAFERSIEKKPDFRPFLPETIMYMKQKGIKNYILK